MTPNSIPVFYHIPKNAGTYVYRSMFDNINIFNKKNNRVIQVLEGQYQLAKIIISEDTNVLLDYKILTPLNKAKTLWNLNVEDLTEGFLQNLSILSVIVEARGFGCLNTVLLQLFLFLSKFKLYEFILVREPFARQQSLYCYLTSDKSEHEPTHKLFKASSFEDHIMSRQLDDCWLIRILLNIPYNVKLTEEDFNETCKYLQALKVYDVKDAEKAVKDALLQCFDIKEPKDPTKRNENSYEKIKFEDLPEHVQKRFTERTYWDKRLYEYLIQKSTFNTSTL